MFVHIGPLNSLGFSVQWFVSQSLDSLHPSPSGQTSSPEGEIKKREKKNSLILSVHAVYPKNPYVNSGCVDGSSITPEPRAGKWKPGRLFLLSLSFQSWTQTSSILKYSFILTVGSDTWQCRGILSPMNIRPDVLWCIIVHHTLHPNNVDAPGCCISADQPLEQQVRRIRKIRIKYRQLNSTKQMLFCAWHDIQGQNIFFYSQLNFPLFKLFQCSFPHTSRKSGGELGSLNSAKELH